MIASDVVLDSLRRLKSAMSVCNDHAIRDHACTIIRNIFDNAPKIGIDIDGTIDENVEFFRLFTKIWPGEIIIITMRHDKRCIANYLDNLGISYDNIVEVQRHQDKAKVVTSMGISVLIDDTDECILNVPDSVTVLKVRNGGNFCDGKWLYTEHTGKLLS